MKKKQRHTATAILLHWVYAPAVIVSIFSGLYIHRPTRFLGFENMDSAKKTHAISHYALIFSSIARFLYSIKNRNYKQIIPDRKTWKDIPNFIKYEFFLTDREKKYPKYNPGQKILITNFAFLVPIQIITGLILYSKIWEGTARPARGLNPLRMFHYLIAVMMTSTVSAHLYFALTHGLKKLKSIVTGYA